MYSRVLFSLTPSFVKSASLLGITRSVLIISKAMSIDIGGMRCPYKQRLETFTEDDLVSKEPFKQFKNWFDLACETKSILEPNAMCLATSTKDGVPSARYVLLKQYGPEGFQFYTNYGSQKGRELDANPRAALVFYWEALQRSVRVTGKVEKLPPGVSDAYFQSRPVEKQIGACISEQSQPIKSRDVLMEKEQQMKEHLAQGSSVVTRPPCWGGYIVVPEAVEFWQGQSDRLHDRIRFRRRRPDDVVDNVLLHEGDQDWLYERLSP